MTVAKWNMCPIVHAETEAGIEIRRNKHVNNIVEQDHRAIKRRAGNTERYECGDPFSHPELSQCHDAGQTRGSLQIMKAIEAMTVSTVFVRNEYVRADSKMVFDRYLARVKRRLNPGTSEICRKSCARSQGPMASVP